MKLLAYGWMSSGITPSTTTRRMYVGFAFCVYRLWSQDRYPPCEFCVQTKENDSDNKEEEKKSKVGLFGLDGEDTDSNTEHENIGEDALVGKDKFIDDSQTKHGYAKVVVKSRATAAPASTGT